MDKPILMDADIDKCAERSDVRDYALKGHSLLDVIDRHHVFAEGRLLEDRTRVASRFLELFDDIPERRLSDIARDVLPDVNPVRQQRIADEILHRNPKILRHLFDERIALGVYA